MVGKPLPITTAVIEAGLTAKDCVGAAKRARPVSPRFSTDEEEEDDTLIICVDEEKEPLSPSPPKTARRTDSIEGCSPVLSPPDSPRRK